MVRAEELRSALPLGEVNKEPACEGIGPTLWSKPLTARYCRLPRAQCAL